MKIEYKTIEYYLHPCSFLFGFTGGVGGGGEGGFERR